MIVKTDAIILRSMKYGETSKILTLYTREFGRMSVIVKGARGEKTKFGAALDVMSHSSVVMYKKDQRELQLLTQADLLQQYRGIIDHPERLMYGFALLEFLTVTVHGEEAHEDLYTVLETSLAALNADDARPAAVLLHYLLRLIHALGIGLDAQHCTRCRADLGDESTLQNHAAFSEIHGGFTCSQCPPAPNSMQTGIETVGVLRWLDTHAVGLSSKLSISDRAAKEGMQLLQRHLASHVPEMRKVKSLSMLDLFS
ncbi:MAG: DNA repair protein RecO [Bacteroidota bacterium]|jgi:DNA repair protein RecO (recombination protein O)